MGVECDYFLAPSAVVAAETLFELLSPDDLPAGHIPTRMVSLKGLMPNVSLRMVERLVTGGSLDTAEDDSYPVIAMVDDGPLVVRVSETLGRALVALDDARLDVLAQQWVNSEEWSDADGDVGNAAAAPGQIADLYREGHRIGQSHYCRVWF